MMSARHLRASLRTVNERITTKNEYYFERAYQHSTLLQDQILIHIGTLDQSMRPYLGQLDASRQRFLAAKTRRDTKSFVLFIQEGTRSFMPDIKALRAMTQIQSVGHCQRGDSEPIQSSNRR